MLKVKSSTENFKQPTNFEFINNVVYSVIADTNTSKTTAVMYGECEVYNVHRYKRKDTALEESRNEYYKIQRKQHALDDSLTFFAIQDNSA